MTALERQPEARRVASTERGYQVGDWYWYGDEFVVVERVGSNFVGIRNVYGGGWRLLFEEADQNLRREVAPAAIIAAEQHKYREQLKSAIGRLQELTAGLGLPPLLPQGVPDAEAGTDNPCNALATRRDTDAYRAALTVAEKTSVPALREEIKEAAANLKTWMAVDLTGLVLQLGHLNKVGDAIKDRLTSLSIYAGLCEDAVQIREGAPAELLDKLHVFQRLAYMDEECLTAYQVGGITCESVEDFDAWLAVEENFSRLLPMSRSAVAFRVRRRAAARPVYQFLDLFVNIRLEQEDKRTFLYVRNGQQLWRIDTEFDFQEKLFPSPSEFRSKEKLWAHVWAGGNVEIVPDGEYQAARKEWRKKDKERKRWKKDHPGESMPYHLQCLWSIPYESYGPFDPSNVYYDDIAAHLRQEAAEYNRVALLLQGIYDRSAVLHPHPPVRLGTAEGFAQTVVLVQDAEGVLTSGDAPDFERYASELRASIGSDSVTIGQEAVWLEHVRAREAKRVAESWRTTNREAAIVYAEKHFWPYGNDGPGYVAALAEWQPRARKAVYRWKRERCGHSYSEEQLWSTVTVEAARLFNVSAYRPGDFRQFYQDTRTRALYAQWAPVLLAAEEYHAGNLKLGERQTALRKRRAKR